MSGKVITVLGAECTGKTSLALALATRIAAETGLPCLAVAETLREWCDNAGRTPRANEQAAIASEHQRRIDAAAAGHAVVVADTTPLMTAVYSQLLFDDHSLLPMAVQAQHSVALTLLTALDLPWQADGLQRDGPHVREPVDRALRALLLQHGLAWSVIAGQGPARLENALNAATPLLVGLAPAGQGLFTRLADRQAAMPAWRWACEKCDQPDCEHALLASLQGR